MVNCRFSICGPIREKYFCGLKTSANPKIRHFSLVNKGLKCSYSKMAINQKKYSGRNLRPNYRSLCHEKRRKLAISGLIPLRNVRICGLRINHNNFRICYWWTGPPYKFADLRCRTNPRIFSDFRFADKQKDLRAHL
jgi:hypothetical protein